MNLSLQNFKNTRILVIGDLMLDRYMHGTTSRISPEAPVPIVKIKEITECPGGAGNVALNAKSIGGEVSVFGIIGADAAGIVLEHTLQNAEIISYLQKTSSPTITKTRVIAHHQQLIRLDQEENHPIDFDKSKFLSVYKKQLPNTDVVIISDYGKGIACISNDIIKLAKAKKIPVLIDPKGKDFSVYRGATLITPNLAEFETVMGVCANENELAQKGLALLADHDFSAVLITRGADGMTLVRANQDPMHMPTNVREVYDVTGAGDTVIAALGVALAAGEDLVKAMEIANIAAGITVRKLGAAAVSMPELRRAMKKKYNSWLGITSVERLLQDAADAKAHGEKIVMTNGCFDVLHAGHVAYLEQAKSLGTRLIVAINDDASVKRLKGTGRPINNLEHRMAVLAGLQAVDWVVPFTEDTPERVINAITPDVLVKGGDWQPHEIVGAGHVIKHGGEVRSLSYLAGHSTSTIINRIKQGTKK